MDASPGHLPPPGSDAEILGRALAWLREGRPVALATVVATWGSSPRPVGSQLVVAGDGEMAGSVSGGCVEGAVVTEARTVLESGESSVVEYGVQDEEAWAVGLACGGRIRVLLVSLAGREALVEGLVQALAEPREATLVLPLDGEAPSLRDREAGGEGPGGGAAPGSRWAGPEERVFLRVYPVPLRLVIVGAVHIAQPLAAMARTVGFRVQVLDPRAAFATPERFPGTTLIRAWPREGWERVDPDHRTAVVTLTHDDKLDDPALEEALAGPAFYVGALGSRRTHARRRGRLLEAGLDPEVVDRIHAPVGLDIGASTPEEIALAVLAEIVAVHRARGGRR